MPAIRAHPLDDVPDLLDGASDHQPDLITKAALLHLA